MLLTVGSILVSLLVLNFSVEFYGISSARNFLGDDLKGLHFLFLFGVMMIGILFGVLFRHINANEEFKGFFPSVKAALREKEFSLSVLVSPVVFCGIYQVTAENTLASSSLIIAFQNGFFWHSVIESMKKS